MEFQCRVFVQRRSTSCCSSVENIPLQAERHSARRQKLVRRPTGIGVHLQTGMLFGITTESCSVSERNRVHLRPDSPPSEKMKLSDNLVFNSQEFSDDVANFLQHAKCSRYVPKRSGTLGVESEA